MDLSASGGVTLRHDQEMQIHHIGTRVSSEHVVLSLREILVKVVAVAVSQRFGQFIEGMITQIGFHHAAVSKSSGRIGGSIDAVGSGAQEGAVPHGLVAVQSLRHQQGQVLASAAQSMARNLRKKNREWFDDHLK